MTTQNFQIGDKVKSKKYPKLGIGTIVDIDPTFPQCIVEIVDAEGPCRDVWTLETIEKVEG